MAHYTSLLNVLGVALGNKYQTVYQWRESLDSPWWIFVPIEMDKPLLILSMHDLIRTRCLNLDTLLSFVRPYRPPGEAAIRAQCRQCGATDLDHFYTSKRDQTMLCPACFAERESRQVAKEEIALSSPRA